MTQAAGQSLGFWRCWALVVGGAIGSAIFIMPALVAPYGGLGLVSWAAAAMKAHAFAGPCSSPWQRACRRSSAR